MDPESHWAGLLADYAPPHPERSWFEPQLWPLLRAAAEQPALRRVYPILALNRLTMFHSPEVFRSAPEDRWPAVVVGSDGLYAVVSDAWSDEATMFLTTADPGLAAEKLASLVEEILNSGM